MGVVRPEHSKSVAFVLMLLASCGAAPRPATPELRRYQTPYYVIDTDLDEPDAAEAVVRLTKLADAFRVHTRALGFTGRIESRLPIYLFRNRDDYLATGAPPESAGAFLGDRVAAAATHPGGAPAWNVIQHEAFHQFAAAVRGPELPGWVNEGLGEYFGEALFTGDGYESGMIPAWRAARVKKSIKEGRFKPLAELRRMSQDDWNQKVVLANYDQAWSVVQFILDGEGGGQRALSAFVKDLADGRPAGEALADRFGDAGAFERRGRAYWLGLPDDGTPDRYAEAATSTVTRFVARAAAVGQSFETFDAFLAAANDGVLRARGEHWIPARLLPEAMRWAPEGSKWSLDPTEGSASRVVLTLRDGRRIVGTFSLRPGQPPEVLVRQESNPGR